MRRRRWESLVFAFVCALSATALACTGANQNKAKKDDPYVVVCNEKPMTGSNIGRLRCWKKMDMEERARRDRQSMERIQFNTARPKDVHGGGGGGGF